MIDSEKLISLWKRQNEITKRVASGGLDIDLALARTQHILDDVYPSKPAFTTPDWDETLEVKIKAISDFLVQNGNEPGFTPADIPAPPTNFIPRTPTEVLMLEVTLPDNGKVKLTQRNFDSKWGRVVAPEGFSKYRWSELKSGVKFLRYVKGKTKTPGMRWIGFDPEVYIGLSPDQALEQAMKDGVTLGADEVLTAAFVFPKWLKSLDGKKWHFPNLSAYQFFWNADWRSTPYLSRWLDDRQLELDAYSSDDANDRWSSCAVREL